MLSLIAGAVFVVLGMAGRTWYANIMSADAATARQANGYLLWFIPAMAM